MTILLIAHIAIALASIVHAGYVYMVPSRKKLHQSYALVVMTLFTGTFLIVSTHSALLPACTTGLLYLGAVASGLVTARRKLAAQNQRYYRPKNGPGHG